MVSNHRTFKTPETMTLKSKTLIQNEFGDVIKSLSLYDVISYSRPNKHRHPEIRMIRIVGPPPGPAGDY